MIRTTNQAQPEVAQVTPAGRDELPLHRGVSSPRARPILERDIEAYLVERVKALGGKVRKVKWLGIDGAPDRLVLLPEIRREGLLHIRTGRAIWVELKRPGAKPTLRQLREHAAMRAFGQRVEVVDSFERVNEVLGA